MTHQRVTDSPASDHPSERPSGQSSGQPAPTDRTDLTELVGLLRLINLGDLRMRHEVSRELGIGLTDLTALSVLESQERPTPKSLADALSITAGSATSLVDRLVKADLVARDSHPTDRRSLLLRLTARGEDAVALVAGRYAAAARNALDGGTPDTVSVADFVGRLGSALGRAAS